MASLRALRRRVVSVVVTLTAAVAVVIGPAPPAVAGPGPPLSAAPDGAIAESVAPSLVHPGDIVTWTIVVKNTKAATADDVVVTDALVSSCAKVLGSLTAAQTTTYVCTSPAPDATFTNVATVAGGPSADQLTGTASALLTVIDPAITITKTTDHPSYHVGETVRYEITIENAGNAELTRVAVADSGDASCARTVGSLAAGATTTYTCTATAPVNHNASTAAASGKDELGRTVRSTSTVRVPVIHPALTLARSVQPIKAISPNRAVTYSYRVTNSGDVPITRLSIVGPPMPSHSRKPTITCLETTLAVDASTTCTAPRPASQVGVGTAIASGKDPLNQTVTSNPSRATPAARTQASTLAPTLAPTKAAIAAQSPLSLVKHAAVNDLDADGQIGVGDTISWTFTITNTGNATIDAVAVSDAQAGTVTCAATTLASGAATDCAATTAYVITQADVDAGHVANTATASGTDQSATVVTSDPSSTDTLIPAAPALTLGKLAVPLTVAAVGDPVDYTFVVTNSGNVTVSAISVDDTLAPPAGPALTITCPVTTLTPTASTSCTASYPATQADLDHGSIDNAATASGTDPSGAPVQSNQSTASVGVAQAPALSIHKSAFPTTVSAVDQLVVYSFLVTNTGNVTVAGVAITDTLAPPASPALTITCPPTPIAPTQSATCTATYLVTQADLDHGSIDNSAVASGTDPSGAPVTSLSDSTTVTVDQQPALTVVKQATPTTVTTVGDTVDYTFLVTNTGNVTLTAITVDDTLAAPASPELTPVCPLTTLAPTDMTTCTATYVVTQADLDNGGIDNVATVSGQDPAGKTVTSPQSTAAVGVASAAALTLKKSASPISVTAAGDTVVYSFLVTNSGNVTVANVGVADTLTAPAGPALAVVCPTGPLAPSGSVTCTASYTVTQADVDHGFVDNSAVASGTDPTGGPITSLPDSARVTVAQTASLSLVKSASPAIVTTVGQPVTYSFVVTNTGNVTEDNIAVDDIFSAPAGPPLTVTCPVTTLAPQALTICTATYDTTLADFDNGTIDNSATASGTDPAGTAVVSNLSAASVGVTQSPVLTVVKSATPSTASAAGDSVLYTFDVTNLGNVTVSGLAIDDTFTAPAGPALTITCATTTLAPQQTTTCSGTYTVSQADADKATIDNAAVATGTGPNGASVTSAPSTATVRIIQSPDLSVAKTAKPGTVTAAGQTVTYTFVVTNTGNVTVDGISIVDVLTAPAGPALSVSCLSTTLAPTDTTTCQATYTVTLADMNVGSIDNSATAKGTSAAGDPVVSGPSMATVTATPLPGIALVKAASPTTVTHIGQLVTYSFTVTNTGNVTLSTVSVADTFTAPAGPELTPVCPATALDPGEATICTAVYTTTPADFDHGRIHNSATATGDPPTGPSVTSNRSSAEVAAMAIPAVAMVKSARVADIDRDGVPDLNDTILWTFMVTNFGNVSLTGISVQDPVAGEVACPKGLVAADASVVCTADRPHVIDQQDVDAGHVDNTATASGTSPTTGTSVTSQPSSTSTALGAVPGLILVKRGAVVDSNSDARVDAGDGVVWTFAVTNTGNVTVTDLAITDPTAGTVTCLVTSVAPGTGTSCTADTRHTLTVVDVNRGSITNTARAGGTGPGGGAVTSLPSTATVSLTGLPALGLVKTAVVSDTNHDGLDGAGDIVVWTFRITDLGSVTVRDIVVLDPTAGAITCPQPTLTPGSRMTCQSVAHTITASEAASGKLSNTATASGVGPSGEPTTSPPSTATIRTHGASPSDNGKTPIAFTGPNDLPVLAWFGLWALLLGLLLNVGRRARRRRT